MTFSRINPPSWGVGAKLTAAQINALDIQLAKALDKTGDTVSSGTIAFGTSQTITHAGFLSVSGTLATTGLVGFNGGTAAQFASASSCAFASGSTTTFQFGSTLSIATLGATLTGKLAIPAPGYIDVQAGGLIQFATTAQLTMLGNQYVSSGTGRITTTAGGRIVLSDNDWIQISAARTLSPSRFSM